MPAGLEEEPGHHNCHTQEVKTGPRRAPNPAPGSLQINERIQRSPWVRTSIRPQGFANGESVESAGHSGVSWGPGSGWGEGGQRRKPTGGVLRETQGHTAAGEEGKCPEAFRVQEMLGTKGETQSVSRAGEQTNVALGG